MPRKTGSANDPDRRERILAAARETISELGVHATTHRIIAQKASVPLGSLTYHFSSISEIIETVFKTLSQELSQEFRAAIESAESDDDIIEKLTGFIHAVGAKDSKATKALFEIYSYAQYNSTTYKIVQDWMLATKSLLAVRYGEEKAVALDALVEGFFIRQKFEEHPLPSNQISAGLKAIIAS